MIGTLVVRVPNALERVAALWKTYVLLASLACACEVAGRVGKAGVLVARPVGWLACVGLGEQLPSCLGGC